MVSEAVANEERRYLNVEIGRALTAICKRNSPATALAEFNEAVADVKASIASGEFTLREWLQCLRECK